MRLLTNISLEGSDGKTQPYMIQLFPFDGEKQNNLTSCTFIPYDNSIKQAELIIDNNIIKDGNEWYVIGNVEYNHHDFEQATVRLYFPQYSVDTFSKNAIYMLDLYTFIHGKSVQLGCYKFKRSEALACVPMRFDGMDYYYEYIDFVIVDPFFLHYSDNTQEIRNGLGEPDNQNNTGSLLYVCLNVVEDYEDHYIKEQEWTSGQNSILIYDPEDLKLSLNYLYANERYLNDPIKLSLSFNKEYDDLNEYMRETYFLDDYDINWEYVVMDEDNIYCTQSLIEKNNEVTMPVDEFFNKCWENWKEGLFISASASFINKNNDEVFMSVFSNKLPITENLFSYLINDNSNLNLIETDMDNNVYNVINIIQNEVVNPIMPTDLAKNHIIQPIFYQTRNIGNVVIHPAVTENISINLDEYKSNVKRFILQVEGTTFKEIGRTPKGIIFKIAGNNLPKEVSEGTLYILNQDLDLVTTGKYIYSY